ncbi:MAG: FtsW/RodA/SpoVE family cell cycle protein [Oscillospiraceae bacterium]|nr:FtsW/RodA/SpoVE family cell cycle protein [Oscillospiraceae bacterium]
MNNVNRTVKRTDMILMFICIIISIISILSLYIISVSFFNTKHIFVVQVVASVIGILTAFFISSIDYHFVVKLWKIYVPVSIFFVVLTFFIGSQRGGADDKAWIMLPYGMSFQPSEFLKICFILSFSTHLSLVLSEINKIKNILLVCLHGFIPILLTHLQGDDGTSLIFIIIFIMMVFSAGISWRYIFLAIILGASLIPVLWCIIDQDKRNRILIALHPETDPMGSGYQQFNGLISIGNGGFLGKGIFENNYKFVPEIQNDFIFSFIGQFSGYLGSLLVLFIISVLLLRILSISLKTEDYLGRFICVGVFGMIFSQVVFNIGMNISILPVIGVTLPLVSAGGSSVVTTYIGIGLVLSVFTYNNKTLFYKHKFL